MTLNLSEAKNHDCRHHPRGSVRRASGFVLTGNPETILPPDLRASEPKQIDEVSSSLGIRAEVYSPGYLRRKAIPEGSL